MVTSCEFVPLLVLKLAWFNLKLKISAILTLHKVVVVYLFQ